MQWECAHEFAHFGIFLAMIREQTSIFLHSSKVVKKWLEKWFYQLRWQIDEIGGNGARNARRSRLSDATGDTGTSWHSARAHVSLCSLSG